MTRNELREYILRQLGSPIHNVEITVDQLNDCITNAVDRFTERHYDSVIMALYKIQLVDGQSSYQLPHSVKSVINVFPGNNVCSSISGLEQMLIPITPMPYQDYLWRMDDVTSITTMRMSIKTWEDAISNQNLIFDWNYSMHRFTLLGDIRNVADKYPSAGVFYLLVYESPDEEIDDLFDNRWLKNYASALSKKQWATNLYKYNGCALPGGAELNYDGIMTDANDEIQKLEEQLEDEFVLPPSFLIG